MSNTVAKTRETLIKDVDKLKRDAFQVAEDVREHAGAHVDQGRQRINDTYDTVRETLTNNPLALVGIGFALGILLSFRFRR
jgi:ElaB/YqjD/DUF883 family membrane-anchored ribosome-binding protein